MAWAYRLNQWLWGSLDWIFPPICGGCGREGSRWCHDCRQQVQQVPEPVCRTCGLPLPRPGLCPSCSNLRPSYQTMRSWLIFEGPIRRALHTLKYRRNVALGDALALHLAEYVRELDWSVDLVVPVPLGRQRMTERGYNQVGLVARPLAALQDWRYLPQILVRVRETRSQVGLSAVERQENVANAFRSDATQVSGKNILVMDDVATTGATLASCSDALMNSGARAVYALTLARALPHHGLQIV